MAPVQLFIGVELNEKNKSIVTNFIQDGNKLDDHIILLNLDCEEPADKQSAMNIFLYGKKDHKNINNLRFIMSSNTKNDINVINGNEFFKIYLRNKLRKLDRSRENNYEISKKNSNKIQRRPSLDNINESDNDIARYI